MYLTVIDLNLRDKLPHSYPVAHMTCLSWFVNKSQYSQERGTETKSHVK